MSRLAVLGAAGFFTAGILCVVASLAGWNLRGLPTARPSLPVPRATAARLAAAAVAGAAVAATTHLVALGVLAALLVDGLPGFFTGSRAWAAHTRRTRAMAEWTRTLADLTRAGNGLREAIAAATARAPEAVRPDVAAFAADLDQVPFARAGARLGDRLDDEEADTVLASLTLVAAGNAGDVADALAELAADLQETADAGQRIDVGRATTRAEVRAVALLSLGPLVLFFWLNRSLLAGIRGAGWQLAFLASGLLFVAGHRFLAWMDRPPTSYRHAMPEGMS